MISRTATRAKISPVRGWLSNPDRRRRRQSITLSGSCKCLCLAGAASLIDDIRADLRAEGIPTAIRRHDTATLFDWLISALSYQGISDQVATEYMNATVGPDGPISRQGATNPTFPKLKSYWHFHGCRYDKISRTCSEPDHFDACPLPPISCATGGSTRWPTRYYCSFATSPTATWWLDRPTIQAAMTRPPQSARPTAEALDRTAPGGLWRLDKVLTMTVVYPARRP